MSDAVVAELAGAGLALTAKWVDGGMPREATAPGVGAASRDVEVAELRAELDAYRAQIVQPRRDNESLLSCVAPVREENAYLRSRARLAEAENVALHTEVTWLWVELRQARQWPVLPTSANPEHVRRMAEVLWMACGTGQDWTLMARAALDALPELVGK